MVIADISLQAAEIVAAEIAEAGGKAAAFAANVAKEEDAQATVEFAQKTYGCLHLAFNNASIIGPEQQVGKLTPEGWRSVIDINGVFYGTHYQIPAILASGGAPLIAQWTDTELKSALERIYPIGRLGKAKEVAEVVCFLVSNKASFVNGSQMVVDCDYLSV